jgi:glycosyltransferase involved in cell wall biosynthesis
MSASLADEPRPLVSTVIAAHNAAAFLAEAVDSVLAQTMKDYEVIIVDDGSTDSTSEVSASYGARVRGFRTPHAGAAAARNLGIREARGELIAFLDADDAWLESKLERQVAVFKARPEIAMVFTGHRLRDETGVRDSVRGQDKRTRLMQGDLVRNIFMTSGVATPTVMVRKGVLDAIGPFDEQLVMAEDDNMWMRIAARCPVELLDEPLTTIRLHSQSMTRDLGALLQSVNRSAERIRESYPEVWVHIEKHVPEKLASFHLAMGEEYFSEGHYAQARESFGNGLNLSSRSAFRYRIYRWMCSLPAGVLRALWGIRARLKAVRSAQ